MGDRVNLDTYAACIHILNMIETAKHELDTTTTERNIISWIKANPKVLRMHNDKKQTIGMIAADFGLCEVVDVALKDDLSSIQQDYLGKNIGIHFAEYALKHQYNVKSYTYADGYIEALVIKALKNKYASIQRDVNGNNIGMIAVKLGSKKIEKQALKNDVACRQKNKAGKTILDILNDLKTKEEGFDIGR